MINALIKKCTSATLVIFLLFTNTAWASVDSDLHDFFNGLGYQSNVTTPTAFQDQAAGYYTGGSLFLRNQVKNYQLVSVELPSYTGGCSGIDTYLGSFSVMNSSEFIKMMKNILSSGGAYAFDLALTTTLPQERSVKDALQRYLTLINNANINSCNTAEDLVGGLWPKTQSSQQQICRDVSSHNGLFTDWAEARQGCGTGGQFDKGIGDGGARKNEVIVNKNLVWDALQSNGFSANDRELAEFLMSLSGTIIFKEDGHGTQKTVTPSLANNQNTIKALLNGGTATLLRCDEVTKCLQPVESSVTISKENGLVSQVVLMIAQLNAEVASDSGQLSQATRGFLEMTPVPVLKYITNSLSLGKSINPNAYSDIIAVSLLNQYLSENIRLVQSALMREDTPMSSEMAAEINDAQKLIVSTMAESYRKLTNINVLVNNLRADEQQLASRLVSQAMVGQESR